MTVTIEVFADITCPFTHVGLKVITAEIGALDTPVDLWVRAWPLEWVNGTPLDADGVAVKAAALQDQLDIDYFQGPRLDRWPATTIPALNLANSAYERDAECGLGVSMQLRSLLFEEGQNIAEPALLAEVAQDFDLPAPETEACAGVRADYADGKRRGVRGSPDFWVEGHEFFCPSLDIGHDDDGSLTAGFDNEGIRQFIRNLH